MGKYGEYKDTKLDLMRVVLEPNICKNNPNISNNMENQPMKENKDIITTCTNGIVSKTMKLCGLPTGEFGSCMVFCASNGWDKGVITCISA